MNVTYLLAEHGEEMPLEGGNSLLTPANYDIVWSIIPLAVVVFLFAKFVIPKFQEVLDEREDRIKGGMDRAEAAQAEAKAALEKYNAQLADARAEAATIREDARKRGEQIEAEHKAKAEEEAARIIEAGNKQLSANREQVVADLRSDLGQNSINLAERLLGTELSDATQQSGTVDSFLSELDNVAPAARK